MTLTQSAGTASGLQRIAGRAISVKLHPQEVLAAKLGTQYACSKQSEIDSIPRARRMSATDVGTETPSKRSLTQVLLLVRVAFLPV